MVAAHLFNTMVARAASEAARSSVARPRRAVVDSYNPNSFTARVRFQPDDVLSGWMPIASPWVGNGWGMFCAPSQGDQVEVSFQEGGHEAGSVIGRFFGAKNSPRVPALGNAAPPAGEFWLVHQTGSRLRLLNNGDVELFTARDLLATAGRNAVVSVPAGNMTATVQGTGNVTFTGAATLSAASWDVTGNMLVHGDITATGALKDQNAAHGSVGDLRSAYNAHKHTGVQRSTSSTDTTDHLVS